MNIKIIWVRGHQKIPINRPHTDFVLSPIRGGGKSSLLEHRGETYMKNGHTVFDFFGSRDSEGLAWGRNPLVDGVAKANGEKRMCLVHSDNVTVDSSFDSIPMSKLSHAHLNKYDILVSASALHKSLDDEYANVNVITDLLYDRGLRGWDKLTVGIIREASNLYYCYDDVSEVLTENGWKLFKDTRLDELVATRTPDGFIEYQYPSEKQEFEYRGNMIQIGGTTNSRYNLCVTPNHGLVVEASSHHFGGVKYGRRRVGEVEAQEVLDWVKNSKQVNNGQTPFKLLRKAKWVGEDREKVVLPATYHNNKPIEIDIDVFLDLLAWYLSDGNTCTIHKESTGVDTVQITKSDIVNASDVQDIADTLDKVGLNYNYKPKGIRFIIGSAPLARYFVGLGKSYEKYIFKWVKNLPPKRLQGLIKTLCKGDGTTHRETPFLGVYYSTSKRLADDVQEVAIKAGYNATIGIIDNMGKEAYIRGRRIHARRLLYSVTITEGRDVFIGRSMVKEVPYEGKVYDLTVPKHHTLLIRRGGRVCWSSNSRLRVSSSQTQAKAYMIYLIREARHMGLALCMDTLKYTSIDLDIRVLVDNTFFKGQGYMGLPKDLHFIYRYFKPTWMRNMKVNQFAILTKEGNLGVGVFGEVKWHKQEKENILKNLGIEIIAHEGMKLSQPQGRGLSVSDQEHLGIVESCCTNILRKKHGLDTEKHSQRDYAKKIGRSPATITTQIASHDESVASYGYCPACRRSGGRLYQEILKKHQLVGQAIEARENSIVS